MSVTLQINQSAVELLLAHLLRCPQVYSAGRQQLSPELFDGGSELAYRCIWQCAMDYNDQYSNLPPKGALSALAVNLALGIDGLPPTVVDEINDILDWVFGSELPDEDLVPDCALDLLRTFLMDRKIGKKLTYATTAAGDGTLPDLPKFITSLMKEMQVISSVQSHPSGLVVPEFWNNNELQPVPSGISLLDSKMGGGAKPGETNVILAPTGVGKTLLSIQLLASQAALQQALEDNKIVKPGLCVMISYEADHKELQARAISYGAKIPQKRLVECKEFTELTTSTTMLPYEKKQQALLLREGKRVRGEQARIADAAEWMNKYMRLVDFSGSTAEGPPRGFNGISEIPPILDHYQQESGMPIKLVVIDWAGMAVTRWILHGGGSLDKQLTVELSSFVQTVGEKIAKPFDCSAWVTHQVTGQANKRSPAATMNHADASRCSAFADFAGFAFVFGTKDTKTNTCMLWCTKTRRAEASGRVICHVNGSFSEIVAADNEFMLDPVTNRIVPRLDMQRLYNPEEGKNDSSTKGYMV